MRTMSRGVVKRAMGITHAHLAVGPPCRCNALPMPVRVPADLISTAHFILRLSYLLLLPRASRIARTVVKSPTVPWTVHAHVILTL